MKGRYRNQNINGNASNFNENSPAWTSQVYIQSCMNFFIHIVGIASNQRDHEKGQDALGQQHAVARALRFANGYCRSFN
jgi:hypothetical protein